MDQGKKALLLTSFNGFKPCLKKGVLDTGVFMNSACSDQLSHVGSQSAQEYTVHPEYALSSCLNYAFFGRLSIPAHMQSGLGMHMFVLQRRSINIDILNDNRICIYIRSCSFECR